MCQFPKRLYKYKKIGEYTSRLLQNGELYFPTFSELGDPNELLFYYEEDNISINASTIVNGSIAGQHVSNAIKSRHGVFCLTESNNDIIMFDYYADGHSGICIEFDWSKIKMTDQNTNTEIFPQKVRYSDKVPFFCSKQPEGFSAIFFTKFLGYAHEKEWRVLSQPYVATIDARNIITGIIFGISTSKEDKTQIKDWLKNWSNILFYQAEMVDKKYALKIVKLDN